MTKANKMASAEATTTYRYLEGRGGSRECQVCNERSDQIRSIERNDEDCERGRCKKLPVLLLNNVKINKRRKERKKEEGTKGSQK